MGAVTGNAAEALRGCGRVVVATGNAHKIVEIKAILSEVLPGTEFVSIRELGDFPDPDETGVTFAENAFIKARAAHEQTGLPAIADDSGLEVDALGGAPGVWSARYAGRHGDDAANNEKLLADMADVPDEARTARFTSCVALVADGLELSGLGHCEGAIGHSLIGDHGFGYDPLFFVRDCPGKTMAQLEPEEKNAISHRYHALCDLAEKLTGARG